MIEALEEEKGRLAKVKRAYQNGKNPVSGEKISAGHAAVGLSRVNREMDVQQLVSELLNIIRIDNLLLSSKAQKGFQKMVRIK
jgi:hypothetical protein